MHPFLIYLLTIFFLILDFFVLRIYHQVASLKKRSHGFDLLTSGALALSSLAITAESDWHETTNCFIKMSLDDVELNSLSQLQKHDFVRLENILKEGAYNNTVM